MTLKRVRARLAGCGPWRNRLRPRQRLRAPGPAADADADHGTGVGFSQIGRRDNPYAAHPGRRLVIEWTAQL